MWEQIIPQLVGAVASKAIQGSPKAEGIDFKKLRADAEAAGFNALTALGATGAAGYERTISEGALSSAAFMGEAVSNGLTSWFNAKSEAANPVPQGGAGAQVNPVRSLAEARQLSYDMGVPDIYGQPTLSFGQPLPTHAYDESGLIQSHPENAVDAETDAWTWAKVGVLPEMISVVWLRNQTTDSLLARLAYPTFGPYGFMGADVGQRQRLVDELRRRGVAAERIGKARAAGLGTMGPFQPTTMTGPSFSVGKTSLSHNSAFANEDFGGW